MNCNLCDMNLEIGSYVTTRLDRHTCENCGTVLDQGMVELVYRGLTYRGSVPTHIFYKVGTRFNICPVCGGPIAQCNVPCGGGIRLEDAIKVSVEEPKSVRDKRHV